MYYFTAFIKRPAGSGGDSEQELASLSVEAGPRPVKAVK